VPQETCFQEEGDVDSVDYDGGVGARRKAVEGLIGGGVQMILKATHTGSNSRKKNLSNICPWRSAYRVAVAF